MNIRGSIGALSRFWNRAFDWKGLLSKSSVWTAQGSLVTSSPLLPVPLGPHALRTATNNCPQIKARETRGCYNVCQLVKMPFVSPFWGKRAGLGCRG